MENYTRNNPTGFPNRKIGHWWIDQWEYWSYRCFKYDEIIPVNHREKDARVSSKTCKDYNNINRCLNVRLSIIMWQDIDIYIIFYHVK